jgi:hypothetical protein
MDPDHLLLLAVNINVNICFSSRIQILLVLSNEENIKYSISRKQERGENRMKMRNISLCKLTISCTIWMGIGTA